MGNAFSSGGPGAASGETGAAGAGRDMSSGDNAGNEPGSGYGISPLQSAAGLLGFVLVAALIGVGFDSFAQNEDIAMMLTFSTILLALFLYTWWLAIYTSGVGFASQASLYSALSLGGLWTIVGVIIAFIMPVANSEYEIQPMGFVGFFAVTSAVVLGIPLAAAVSGKVGVKMGTVLDTSND